MRSIKATIARFSSSIVALSQPGCRTNGGGQPAATTAGQGVSSIDARPRFAAAADPAPTNAHGQPAGVPQPRGNTGSRFSRNAFTPSAKAAPSSSSRCRSAS
jgi:hypothetical protein